MASSSWKSKGIWNNICIAEEKEGKYYINIGIIKLSLSYWNIIENHSYDAIIIYFGIAKGRGVLGRRFPDF